VEGTRLVAGRSRQLGVHPQEQHLPQHKAARRAARADAQRAPDAHRRERGGQRGRMRQRRQRARLGELDAVLVHVHARQPAAARGHLRRLVLRARAV